MATVLSVGASSIVAYGFSRIKFAGRGFWFACMLMTLMLPVQVTIIPQYVAFVNLLELRYIFIVIRPNALLPSGGYIILTLLQ